VLDKARSDPAQAAALHAWERTHDGHSWQAVRPMLFAGLGVVALFLAVTQPGLQSELVGVAGSVATIGATLLKLRDGIGAWIGGRVTGTPS
jgi:hypothetical protein